MQMSQQTEKCFSAGVAPSLGFMQGPSKSKSIQPPTRLPLCTTLAFYPCHDISEAQCGNAYRRFLRSFPPGVARPACPSCPTPLKTYARASPRNRRGKKAGHIRRAGQPYISLCQLTGNSKFLKKNHLMVNSQLSTGFYSIPKL
jgi:hypothetical protein